MEPGKCVTTVVTETYGTLKVDSLPCCSPGLASTFRFPYLTTSMPASIYFVGVLGISCLHPLLRETPCAQPPYNTDSGAPMFPPVAQSPTLNVHLPHPLSPLLTALICESPLSFCSPFLPLVVFLYTIHASIH
ncbi:unnamed protein product, partial [Discosporangium mesarthrocarpum]